MTHSCLPSLGGLRRLQSRHTRKPESCARVCARTQIHQELLLSYMSPTMDAHGEALSLPQYLQVYVYKSVSVSVSGSVSVSVFVCGC